MRSIAWLSIEFGVLAIWTVYLLRNYLDFDPLMVPFGREFFTAMQTHYMWERARDCGMCAMWNGSMRGGYPVFADVHDSMLFPPVVVASLIWGAINGTKAALIFTFFCGGVAQWWLCRVLGIGRVAGLWSAAMAVAAGGLTGRMEDAVIAVVVSTVCCWLVLAATLQLCKDGTRRSAVLLGLVLGLTIAAGQGYLQIGFVMLSPLFLLLIVGSRLAIHRIAKQFAFAAGIGVLIAAPFLVPFLHFYPSFGKWTDPYLNSPQPFRYIPLNLVISDPAFYKSAQLGTLPYPYLYVNYLGWIAVAFAAVGCVALWRRQQYRLLTFLLSWSIGAMWISSAMPLKWIRDITSPGNQLHEFVIGMRFPSLITGLTIPTLLALSAIGVDYLIGALPRVIHLRIGLSAAAESTRLLRFDLRWLIAIPLLLALRGEQQFAENWLWLTRQPVEQMAPVYDALSTDDLQWVEAPFGEEFWVGQAIERGMKLSYTGRVWHWNGRTDPKPVRQAFRQPPDDDKTLVTTVSGIGIYASPPGNEYASVLHPDGTRTICSASGTGGDIDVRCDLPQPGRLEVKENHFSGWKASIAGESIDVENLGGWITAYVPAGQSTIELRYRPWDVPVGIALMVVGLAVAGYCLIRPEPQRAKQDQDAIELVRPGPVGEPAAAD